ncbi:MAG: TolC family protein [Candidatus Limisoma sp.]
MRLFIITSALLVGAAAHAGAYTDVLAQVEKNSTALEARRSLAEARKAANRVGLSPENPEVEFSYQWGSADAQADKKTVSVMQPLDFPTAYGSRRSLANSLNAGEDIELAAERMNILLEAKRLCIDITYQNALHQIYTRQLDNARSIAETYNTLDAAGQVSIIDKKKAQLNLATMQSRLATIEAERARLLAELARLNGGNAINVDVDSFESFTLPADFDTWYTQASAESPLLRYYAQQVIVKEREAKVHRAENLPKLAVGYAGEYVAAEKFQGIAVGVTIPLWGNKSKKKRAQAEITASIAAQHSAEIEHRAQMHKLYERAALLTANTQRLDSALAECNGEDVLLKAYQGGELSLLNYLLEMGYYLEATENLLDSRRELALTVADLTAFEL